MTEHTRDILPAATGPQFELRRAGAHAIVTSLAAGLRHYTREGVALVESYPATATAPGGAGITLAPFANRVDAGRWELHGVPQQLDITEVERNNAIHGLLRNTGYALVHATPHAVELFAVIYPQHGFPFQLRHHVRYELTADGALRVAQTLHNDAATAAPFVLGAHPYLRLGEVPPEDLTLHVQAASRLRADARMIPTGRTAVAGRYDLRQGRPVPESVMDTAFTDLIGDADGAARHCLRAPDGRSVSLWHDASVQYVHVYVSTSFPGRSLAVALEPMTGPANAFNSGDGLRWLAPGEAFTMRWGIDARLAVE